jgi:hypothetical protein
MADFEIQSEILQGITLDILPCIPATFSSRKIHSNQPQTKIHEFMQKRQIEGKERKRKGELGIQILQPWGFIQSTK